MAVTFDLLHGVQDVRHGGGRALGRRVRTRAEAESAAESLISASLWGQADRRGETQARQGNEDHLRQHVHRSASEEPEPRKLENNV